MSGSKTLKRLLSEFSYVSIVGDGNCLFRSLSYAITGNQDTHGAIRQRICDYLLTPNLPRNLRLALTGIDIPSYVAGMRSNAVYGTLIELLAFSHMERRPIIVYYTNASGQYLSEVYNPHYRSPVIYLHLSNEHYSVLAPKSNRRNNRSKPKLSVPSPKPKSLVDSVGSANVPSPKPTSNLTDSLSSLSSDVSDSSDTILSKINEVLRLNTQIVEYYRKGILPSGKTITELESLVNTLTTELNTHSKTDLDLSVSRTKGDEALARLFEEEDIINSEIDSIQKEYSASKTDSDKSKYQERLIELNNDLELVRAKIVSFSKSVDIPKQFGGSELSTSDKIAYLYKKSYAHYKNIYLDLELVRLD